MKRFFKTVLTFAGLTLTSCLQLTDELFLENDGSGRYETRIDAGKMMEMFEMLNTFLPDSLRNKQAPDANALKDSLLGMWSGLEQVSGISDFRQHTENGQVHTVSFRFNNIDALNRALQSQRATPAGNPAENTPAVFTLERRRLVWNQPLPDALGVIGNSLAGEKDMDMEMLKGMMGDMTYTTIIHLPGKIIDHTNRMATVAPDGRTITVVTDLLDKEGLRSRHNDIKFK